MYMFVYGCLDRWGRDGKEELYTHHPHLHHKRPPRESRDGADERGAIEGQAERCHCCKIISTGVGGEDEQSCTCMYIRRWVENTTSDLGKPICQQTDIHTIPVPAYTCT